MRIEAKIFQYHIDGQDTMNQLVLLPSSETEHLQQQLESTTKLRDLLHSRRLQVLQELAGLNHQIKDLDIHSNALQSQINNHERKTNK